MSELIISLAIVCIFAVIIFFYLKDKKYRVWLRENGIKTEGVVLHGLNTSPNYMIMGHTTGSGISVMFVTEMAKRLLLQAS